MKNPTPFELAVTVSLIVTCTATVLISMIKFIWAPSMSWLWVSLFIAILFSTSYMIISYALKEYIYRKIKLIYKTIHRLKVAKSKKKEDINLSNPIIEEVEREVVSWAKDRTQEIDDLKRQEAYRRDFLGNVSHELKTPIFNIQGYVFTLLEGGINDPNINLKYLTRAANNVERLQMIVEDLEVISQFEASALALEMKEFDIVLLAQEVLEDADFKAKGKGITLRFKDSKVPPFIVRADRERIRQVLTNLMSNSIKYGKKGGHTQMSFYQMDNNVLIEVSDNGIGIKEEHLPRLFERFYRVDKGRSREQGGTGLGLAIVKHIIEAHKQTINARSQENVGSTFGFTLRKA